MTNEFTVDGKTYRVIKLLGKGKGGYSYLVENSEKLFCLKQIHHEPCDYYEFGDKIATELRDYQKLANIGILMPKLLYCDLEKEIILKEFIDGPSIAELLSNNQNIDIYIAQIEQIANTLKNHNLNIDYYPTNFIIYKQLLYYVDYECNQYSEEWSFPTWGKQYWTKEKG